MRLEKDDPVSKLLDEAAARFDAWREEHDPNHQLPIEQAAEAYCRHAFANQS